MDMGAGRWDNACVCVLMVGGLVVCASSVLFALTIYYTLSACYQFAPASSADWFTKGRAMCYYVYVIMHVNYLQLFFVRGGHCVPVAGFCKICMC